jgi:hypothetical protein
LFFLLLNELFCRSRSYFTTDSQSACLGIEYPCGTCDLILFPVGMLLSEICGLVSIGRPLSREDGSAICGVITQWSQSLRTRNHNHKVRLPSFVQLYYRWSCSFLCVVTLHVLAYMAIFKCVRCYNIILWPETILYCLIWDSRNLEGQVPVFIFPRNRVTQLYPRALGWVLLSLRGNPLCAFQLFKSPMPFKKPKRWSKKACYRPLYRTKWIQCSTHTLPHLQTDLSSDHFPSASTSCVHFPSVSGRLLPPSIRILSTVRSHCLSIRSISTKLPAFR